MFYVALLNANSLGSVCILLIPSLYYHVLTVGNLDLSKLAQCAFGYVISDPMC